jgi:6-phosphofructokinase 1
MNYRVALSYAGEDRRFVEHVAGILERFLGKKSVFHYTEGQRTEGINGFLNFINEALEEKVIKSDDLFWMVCFVRKRGGQPFVVNGQATELLARGNNVGDRAAGNLTWQEITNSRNAPNLNIKTIIVALPNHENDAQLNDWMIPLSQSEFGRIWLDCNLVTDIDRASAEHVAEFLLRDMLCLGPQTHSSKGFTYEKDAISFYAQLLNFLRQTAFPDMPPEWKTKYEDKFKKGVPLVWPTVRLRTDLELQPNALVMGDGTIGSSRPGISALLPAQPSDSPSEPERLVLSAALSHYHDCAGLAENPDACMIRSGLCFLEAGPRAMIMNRQVQVGIVVCGGIAPGINAVIDGILQRHKKYDKNCSVYGFICGLRALSQGPHEMFAGRRQLTSSAPTDNEFINTVEHVSKGGSMLKTFRLDRLDRPQNKGNLNNVLSNIRELQILYVIGGDGSMKAASLLAEKVRENKLSVSVVGIPKTMDNDILWVWQSFGFATAVEKAREIIECLSTEVCSNPRICVLQLFGSVSGFVVSHAVLSSQPGQCDVALIPEAPFSIRKIADKLASKFRDDGGHIDPTKLPFGMVVMAETAIPEDIEKYKSGAGLTTGEMSALEDYRSESVYLDGQTSDELRSASLKLVVHGIREELRRHFNQVEIITNEPRHILRATNPSFSDIITGQRLGSLAVDNAMAGYSDFMVSQWLTEFVLVPLRLVAMGRKRIPESGIFWKSVLAKTGQGELSMREGQRTTTSAGKHGRKEGAKKSRSKAQRVLPTDVKKRK